MHLEVLLACVQPYTPLLIAFIALYMLLPVLKNELLHGIRCLLWFMLFNYIGADRIHHAFYVLTQFARQAQQAEPEPAIPAFGGGWFGQLGRRANVY